MSLERDKAFFLYGYISETFRQHREHKNEYCSLSNPKEYCAACKAWLAAEGTFKYS